MSEFKINEMSTYWEQSWAKKCDANGDGVIKENEILVFNELKGQISKDNYDNVLIGGVSVKHDDVSGIKYKEQNKQEGYNVKLTNGVEVDYKAQNPNQEGRIFVTEAPNSLVYDAGVVNVPSADVKTPNERFKVFKKTAPTEQ